MTTSTNQGFTYHIRKSLKRRRQKLSGLYLECTKQKAFITTQITQWQHEIQNRRQKIQTDFQNFHTFLNEEEKFYLWKLKEEEEQMLKRLKESEGNLTQKSNELKSHIQKLESKCGSPAQTLLQEGELGDRAGWKDTEDTFTFASSRSYAVKLDPPETFSLEIETECDVSELYLDVRKILRRYQVGVTLDPWTAHPELVVSKDHRQLSREGSLQNLTYSPRRFTFSPCVLGYQRFTSGKHYFEVDIGEGTDCNLGVCIESVERGFDVILEPDFGFWVIGICREQDCANYLAFTSPLTVLHVNERPRVIGVVLHYEAGLVSFYSAVTGSHMFTFAKASFCDTLRPVLYVSQNSPVLLLPCDEQGKEQYLLD
ncbi:E3 ubiquitin-protein ligase TRIM38-like [Ctenodactylus gundi]